MSFNVEEGVQLAINTFGGLITEVPPSNVPETGSPDNQDMQFGPGFVESRSGLRRVFPTPLSAGSPAQVGTITYGKSYVDPKGVIRNLYLDSLGNLWVEDVTNSPGAATLLAALPWAAGSYAKSITAFGREYIAISNGLNGTDIPLQYDGTNLDRVTQDGPGNPAQPFSLFGGKFDMALAGSPGASLERTANVVTATVTGSPPLSMQVGYQALIAGVTAMDVGGGIASIVINNEDLPGRATVTTNSNHGLAPGALVQILNVSNVIVGGTITSASRQGQVVTIITSAPHGLGIGALVTIDLVTNTTFNASFIVQSVLDPNAFTYIQADTDAIDVSGTGRVRLNWPLPNVAAANEFEVLDTPTPTTFQIALSYSDATWVTGNVALPWNGTFYVTAVLNATQFQYLQYGPDGFSTDIGTVTKNGQISPGEHQMQVLFLTRQGYITRPSPPVKFMANGGQYLGVNNIPIGPANVQARILAFTGTRGSQFFYIPVPAMVDGQVVSTATQINDNTTTSIILDFSDNTLFASIGINTLGNNLPAQIVLDGALGFGHFGSRLITYGQRNIVQNLLNMAFDGGYFAFDPTMPTGWLASGSPADPGGALTTDSRFGQAWQTNGDGGFIYQSFYLDAYGAPIATPRAKYTARAWIKGTGTITLTIAGGSPAFTSTVTLTGTNVDGAWVEGNFNNAMPDMISTDMALELSGSAGTIVDEISIIYTDTPFLDPILYGSYVNNPEAFDGLSGKFGPANDPRKVMTFGQIRGVLFLLTRDPSGSLHSITDNGTTEPAGWGIYQVGANCGAISAWALTVSQADDASAGGGEEWIAWIGYNKAMIFGGDQPWKITQEIQPNWDAINPAAVLRAWAFNDPYNRVIYFGLPIGTFTAPSLIYPVDYKGLDTAFQIGQSHPVYRAYGGKMQAGEFCRKWTRWNLTMNGGALMYRAAGLLVPVVFAGNGHDPANPGSPVQPGFGNVYIIDPTQCTDDDYGQIRPYYTTYFFPSHQLEQALGIGTARKMLEYFQFLASGEEGVQLRITFLCDSLNNPWPLTCIRELSADPFFDTEHPGASATGQRIAFKFEPLLP